MGRASVDNLIFLPCSIRFVKFVSGVLIVVWTLILKWMEESKLIGPLLHVQIGANCFIAGSGMFAYDDLSVGCNELRTIATAAQNGKILKPGETIDDLSKVVN